MSEKRYQVYISSTYTDLQAERAAIVQALPTIGCLPVGLEIFATNSLVFAAVKKLIDEADYFILLVGSRYGSLSPSGVSYSHMEYVYASTKQKPILVLMHDAPDSRSIEFQEKTMEGRRQFRDFRQLVSKGLVSGWSDIKNLDSAVRQYLPQLIRSNPASGWIRASSSVLSASTSKEVEYLKQRISELEGEREQWLNQQSSQLGSLAQGSDPYELMYRCKAYAAGNCEDVTMRTVLTWDQIFASISPHLSQPQTEEFLMLRIAEKVQQNALLEVQSLRPKTHAVTDISVSPTSFSTVKIQFRTLGLIRRITRDDQRSWWQLTAQGEQYSASMLAVRR